MNWQIPIPISLTLLLTAFSDRQLVPTEPVSWLLCLLLTGAAVFPARCSQPGQRKPPAALLAAWILYEGRPKVTWLDISVQPGHPRVPASRSLLTARLGAAPPTGRGRHQ